MGKYEELVSLHDFYSCYFICFFLGIFHQKNIWDKVLKNGSSKTCGILALQIFRLYSRTFTWPILEDSVPDILYYLWETSVWHLDDKIIERKTSSRSWITQATVLSPNEMPDSYLLKSVNLRPSSENSLRYP